MRQNDPKVGDLVRYNQSRSRPAVYGFVTEERDSYSIKVRVFNSNDSWFHHDSFWDVSHWEVLSESS
jgi:hypothetical protein